MSERVDEVLYRIVENGISIPPAEQQLTIVLDRSWPMERDAADGSSCKLGMAGSPTHDGGRKHGEEVQDKRALKSQMLVF